MIKRLSIVSVVSIVGLTLLAVTPASAAPPRTPTFGAPVAVTIQGYSGDAMEPFISPNGKYLFFNNRNDPATDTNLFVARKINKTTFRYVGPLNGANSPALDAVATIDSSNNFYFVSTRSYSQTLSTIYRGTFSKGSLLNPSLVSGISKQAAPWVNFDVDISPDGATMYFVDGQINSSGSATTADLAIAQKTSTGFARLPSSTQLLANVNTAGALEYGAAIAKDGRTLYFTRAALPLGSSNPEILVATRASTTTAFGVPTRLTTLTGFVEAPTVTQNGRVLYFHRLVGGRFVIASTTKR